MQGLKLVRTQCHALQGSISPLGCFHFGAEILKSNISFLSTMQGTFCNVPSACDGVALADGTCCLYELSRSGDCCEVVDKDMECCDSGVLDAVGVCQGTAVSIDYNGQACTVRHQTSLSRFVTSALSGSHLGKQACMHCSSRLVVPCFNLPWQACVISMY